MATPTHRVGRLRRVVWGVEEGRGAAGVRVRRACQRWEEDMGERAVRSFFRGVVRWVCGGRPSHAPRGTTEATEQGMQGRPDGSRRTGLSESHTPSQSRDPASSRRSDPSWSHFVTAVLIHPLPVRHDPRPRPTDRPTDRQLLGSPSYPATELLQPPPVTMADTAPVTSRHCRSFPSRARP